ncbi:prostatic acid phosphatase-like [Hetaerina americana]|uniref:prostatic acid phosphatase-like n=1 Tax=Hetaerina americana TaxID=62018 RepID=UPI003A7F3B32
MDNLWGRRRGGAAANRGEMAPGERRAADPRRRRVGRQRICILVTTALTGAALLAVLASMLIMVNGDRSPDDVKTLQVHVLFRHGERTPTETYPNDPYKDDSYWPEGWGQLDNYGKKQLHDLGVYLKNRYGPGGVREIYGGGFNTAETKVLSTDADRCLNSAAALLSGMFPPSASPGGSQVWLPELDWQPVPIRYIERNEDMMIASKKPCARYDEDLQAVYASSEVQKVNQENQDLYNHLSENSGKTYNTILDVEFLYNTLQIEELRGLKLPNWLSGWYPERLRPLASLSLALFTRTLPMKKTKAGVLLWDMATHMGDKISTPTEKNKIFFYSGHDTTIVNMMQALGIADDNFKPDFGTAVLVELLEYTNGDKNVKIYMKNSTSSDELYPIIIPSCPEPCHASGFFNLETITSPKQWEMDCQL